MKETGHAFKKLTIKASGHTYALCYSHLRPHLCGASANLLLPDDFHLSAAPYPPPLTPTPPVQATEVPPGVCCCLKPWELWAMRNQMRQLPDACWHHTLALYLPIYCWPQHGNYSSYLISSKLLSFVCTKVICVPYTNSNKTKKHQEVSFLLMLPSSNLHPSRFTSIHRCALI